MKAYKEYREEKYNYKIKRQALENEYQEKLKKLESTVVEAPDAKPKEKEVVIKEVVKTTIANIDTIKAEFRIPFDLKCVRSIDNHDFNEYVKQKLLSLMSNDIMERIEWIHDFNNYDPLDDTIIGQLKLAKKEEQK